jgi:hypothetical protein
LVRHDEADGSFWDQNVLHELSWRKRGDGRECIVGSDKERKEILAEERFIVVGDDLSSRVTVATVSLAAIPLASNSLSDHG